MTKLSSITVFLAMFASANAFAPAAFPRTVSAFKLGFIHSFGP